MAVAVQQPTLAQVAVPVPTLAQVVAPSNLEAGYRFEATTADGKTFDVTVPEGGVSEGETFIVAVPEEECLEDVDLSDGREEIQKFVVPKGKWRDGLCSCFAQGLCHPWVCLSCWCTMMSLGQVMTRLQLTACGDRTTKYLAQRTFPIVTGIMVAYLILGSMFNSLYRNTSFRTFGILVVVLDFAYAVYYIYIGTRTRMEMRKRFEIGGSCIGDCCITTFCGCCSTSQMARHTHDGKEYRAVCCSNTGLAKDAPDVV